MVDTPIRRRPCADADGALPAEMLFSIAEAALKGLAILGIRVAGRHYEHVEYMLRGTPDDLLAEPEQIGVLAELLLRRITEHPDVLLVAWREPGDVPDAVHLVHADVERDLADTREQLHRAHARIDELKAAIRRCAQVAG